MKPGGKDGFLYLITRGAEKTTITEDDEGFAIISGIAASSSGFPTANGSIDGGKALEVGDLIYIKGTETFGSGDAVIPLTLSLIGGATDVSTEKSKDKYEDTAQEDVADGIRSYTEGALSAQSGSINGYHDVDSAVQQDVENHFNTIIIDDGTNITKKERVSGVLETMLSYRETTEVGEKEVWEYKPMIVDSMSKGKPMDGNQQFNFNYTIDGKMKPRTYYRTIAA